MAARWDPDRWTWGAPPARVEVDCGGERHEVVWRWGKLVALQHDLGAELALAGFGGERAPCLDVYDTWRAVLAGEHRGRPPGELDQVVALARLVRVERRLRRAAEPADAAAEYRYLADRLLREVRDGLDAVSKPWRLAGGRIDLAVQPILPGSASDPDLGIDGTARRLRVRLDLPLGWLLRVWGRGLAVVEDALVLEVVSAQGRSAQNHTVDVVALRLTEGPDVVRFRLTAADGSQGAGAPDRVGPARWQVVARGDAVRFSSPPALWWSIRVRP